MLKAIKNAVVGKDMKNLRLHKKYTMIYNKWKTNK